MRQEDAEELQRKIMSAKFDFNDFLKQTRAVAQMGSMTRVIGMIPGMGKVWFSIGCSQFATVLQHSIFLQITAVVVFTSGKRLLYFMDNIFIVVSVKDITI